MTPGAIIASAKSSARELADALSGLEIPRDAVACFSADAVVRFAASVRESLLESAPQASTRAPIPIASSRLMGISSEEIESALSGSWARKCTCGL